MSEYALQDRAATADDWVGTWTIILSQSSYMPSGCRITIDDGLNILVEASDIDGVWYTLAQASPPEVSVLSTTGQLQILGTAERQTVSAQGTYWPAGTTFVLAGNLFFFTDGTEEHSEMVAMSYVGDPENAGIMSAEGGG